MSAWEYRQIDEDGGMGYARELPDGSFLFAWGFGVEQGEPHPGGWARWVCNEDGDIDDQTHFESDPQWDAEDAMEAADARF